MEGEFHGIDLLFARRITSDPQGQDLLARLLRSVREGELSLGLEKGERLLVEEKLGGIVDKKIVLEGDKLYLQRHFLLKSRFYQDLERIRSAPVGKEVEFLDLSGLNKEQGEALLSCKENTFWIITGGPGTGKSYTLARLIRQFSHALSIVVTAPTGKATARMRELLPEGGYDAMTLHRLLKMGGGEEVEKLSYDLILVDESSMVDITLFTKLVASIKTGSRLILVGDHEQLPPVEGASYFRHLVEECRECTTILGRSLRVEKEELLELARKAHSGEALPTEKLLRPEQLVGNLEERILFREGEGFEKIGQLKILTPLRQGEYGVTALNERFYERQRVLYPKAPIPIIVSINDERFGIYNGDLALLEGDEVLFGDGRRLSRYSLRGYELAYVLSVHKSQGSEYDEVVLLLPPGSARFGRKLLYTAVTRAKKRVIIYS